MKVLLVFHVIEIVIIAVHRLLCLQVCPSPFVAHSPVSSVRTAATNTQDGG